ncbi:MAG: hypothetical protein RIS79_3158, partial [Verrucomicrobiota bacterium]
RGGRQQKQEEDSEIHREGRFYTMKVSEMAMAFRVEEIG